MALSIRGAIPPLRIVSTGPRCSVRTGRSLYKRSLLRSPINGLRRVGNWSTIRLEVISKRRNSWQIGREEDFSDRFRGWRPPRRWRLSRGAACRPGKAAGHAPIKITDLRCAIIGQNPVVRIVTDQGLSGYGQAESAKPYLKPMVLFYKNYLLGEDPTDVERVMLKIRRMGAFKPWGSAVSAIEIALWDIAGQVAGVPVYKLLGGKIRDRVRAYNGGVRFPMTGQTPQDYAENMAKMKEAKEGFTLIKQAVGFHNPAMMRAMPDGWYDEPRTGPPHSDRGLLTERGLEHIIACVEAMKKVLGDEIGLALDCGPGWTVKDAITFARALEPLHIAWLEDIITGDYTPYPNAEVFREVTQSTSLPIHTGEEIYLRENFKDLIEKQAVNVIALAPSADTNS